MSLQLSSVKKAGLTGSRGYNNVDDGKVGASGRNWLRCCEETILKKWVCEKDDAMLANEVLTPKANS